jgi:DNA-binding response OmpR family regulator
VDVLHQKGIDSPVIFLTGRTEPQDEVTGLKLGALDYVRKPVQEESFLLRVKRALEVGMRSRPA